MSEARFTVEYKIGYAEGQRDAEKIKVERAVKEADALRARVQELEAALNDIQCLSPAAAYTSFDSKMIELDYSDYCDYCQKIKELTEVALKKKAGE